MHALLTSRSRVLSEVPLGVGPVLYLMDRDMRIADNHALALAHERANARKVPLIILYCLIPGFLGGSYRQHIFKVEGLTSISKKCESLRIPFFVESTEKPAEAILNFLKKHSISEIVTDFSPLRIQRDIKDVLVREAGVPITEVDTHNLIPAWVVSDKAEVGARTLRPKLYRQSESFPHTHITIPKQDGQYTKPTVNFEEFIVGQTFLRTTPPSDLKGGEEEAELKLKHFIKNVLPTYARDRNNPLTHGQSGLSPYLHYGMLSVFQVVRAIEKSLDLPLTEILDARKNLSKADKHHVPTLKESAGAFLEELIVRKELSDNFCLYHPDTYDTPESFPAWALRSLKEHERDPRAYVYTQEEFEMAHTHDELWNAAQREMVETGKMHGYMRMYWAKKILEWTKDAKTAHRIAIYLNDTYELDGRDPNGYAGIAWSIGGVHDRPWFTRPIFGQVRYMARSGCESKFDVNAYIARYRGDMLPL